MVRPVVVRTFDMLSVLGCLADQHDPLLVAVASVICALSAVTVIGLLRHAQASDDRGRSFWLAVAALAGGSGIWATHFVALMANASALSSTYAIVPTAASLVFAVALTWAGLTIALISDLRGRAWIGGTILGAGIAAMHFAGMVAFEIGGRFSWSADLVAVSIAAGMVFSSLSLSLALRRGAVTFQLASAGLLVCAICGHHVTAMTALAIVPVADLAGPTAAIQPEWMAAAVAVISAMVLAMACAALTLDIRDRRQAGLQGERLRSLANAAVESLVICRGDVIVSANDSFVAIAGVDADRLVGSHLSELLPSDAIHLALDRSGGTPVEARMRGADGHDIPVALVGRGLDYAGEPHVAFSIGDLRARHRAERRIEFLAHHDALTGLPNRTRFHARLDQDMRVADALCGRLAVLSLDLDGFKEINDLFGQAGGDAVLRRVATVVSGLLDGAMTMGRLGGDEFGIICPCHQAVAAGRLAERIMAALRQTKCTGANASIGIALFPDDATGREDLMNAAATALSRAKAQARGGYRFFEAQMGSEVRERRSIEHDLRHAIARGELRVVYQPQTDVQTGVTTGFEALLRWVHPERGTVSPGIFIPIAEECAIILEIGDWVLREACREAARWTNPLGIAVNVSGVQIHTPGFVGSVREILAEAGLDPARLEIEITETALIRDPAHALSALLELKALGIGIAMDDFGTGYSSLSNLRSFPFGKIKIDRSFIHGVDLNRQAAAIVRSVLGLGRGLGLPVLAEGVETAGELRFLQAENCDSAQGYLMGRPGEIALFSDATHGTPERTEIPAKAA
ncbi:EAL domain-containing protein [Methylobacterium sp. Leaf108]|uniref:bifunctional diguanylate cyclase/phosphodiesterase n=1 Tax=Methylobacterium sp. Leaf108 TaxID=1736256 RepID=UPI000AB95619